MIARSFAATAIALASACLLVPPALASGGAPADSGAPVDPQYKAGVDAIQAGHYPQGIEQLEAYVARKPENAGNADAQNWLGFAYRKSGNLDAAFLHYDKALAIDPKHRGAHEYVGEAYLMVGNLAKAEEHLHILDKLCWMPCEPYTTLKKAVAEYRTAHPDAADPGRTASAH